MRRATTGKLAPPPTVRMDKKTKALDILAQISGRPAGEIEPSMELVGDLGIDSPKALELLVELEDALEIEISDEDAARMERVEHILGYIGAA